LGAFGQDSHLPLKRRESAEGDCDTTMNVGNLWRRLTLRVRQDGQRLQARLAAKRGVSLALVAAIHIADLAIPWTGWDYMPRWRGTELRTMSLRRRPFAVATALIAG